MTEPVRLAKRVAELFACSRREAELYIEGGWVRVDGQVVLLPQFRVASQTVTLDREARAETPAAVTLLVHKPAGVDPDAVGLAALVADAAHAASDASGIAPHPKHRSKLQIAFPLPTAASGLLVLTQDWHLQRKLSERYADIEQEWIVELAAEPSAEALAQLKKPLFLDGRKLPPLHVSQQSEKRLRFALKDCQPGQIEYLCADAGLRLVAMKRLRLGRLPLAGLPEGQWRYLGQHERF